MERMGQRRGSNQNSRPPVLVPQPLCNQFTHYHIRSRGVFGINHFKLRNFAVVAIECLFATVDRGSIIARTHRWCVMITYDGNSSTTVISMGMEHLSLVKLLININRLTTIIKYFGGYKIQLDATCQVLFLLRKQDFFIFCSIPCFINSCMKVVQVGVIYNTLLDSNEGNLHTYASKTIYFFNINENRISDRETPVELLSLEPQYCSEPYW